MTDSLKVAAKAGDIKALEALMNQSFEPKGITVRVTSSGSFLKIIVRAKNAPDKALLSTIQRGFASISPNGFDRVSVTARAVGKADAWSEQWELPQGAATESLSVTTSSPPPSKPASTILVGDERATKWYQKSWLIISLLIFFPPGGIALAWVSKWPKVGKIGVSIVSGLWLLAILVPLPHEPESEIAQEDTQAPAAELTTEESETQAVEAAPAASDRTFADAVNQAMAAAEAGQSAKTPEEWKNVATLWTQAIDLMKAVPETDLNYDVAQLKVNEYQKNLAYAKQKSSELTPHLNLSKTELSSYFSQRGLDYSFKEIPLTDGSPRLVGSALGNLVSIELYGSNDLVTEAVIVTFIGEGVPSDLLATHNLAFLNKVAPGYDWEAMLIQIMNELFENKSEEKQRIRADNKIVSIKLNHIAETGVYMLLISVEPSI